jgi:CBS domain containing-hemolysin-like protein
MNVIYMIIILVIFMIILIYLSGWLAGSETAITNITSSEIAEMKRKNEKNIDYLLKSRRNLDRTLVAILIVNNIVNIVLSSVAAVMANELFQAVGVSIMIAIVTILIILFGEIIPKSNAIWNTKKVARNNSKSLYYLTRATNPLVVFFMGISSGIFRLIGKPAGKESLILTDDSIKGIATLGEEEGIIKKIERDIIHNVFIFGDKKTEDIMVPMGKVFYIHKNIELSKAKKLVAQHGFTRVPVTDVDDEVIGVLYNKDLIDKTKGTVETIMREPYFVSAKNDITDIFNEMKRKRIHLAIVRNDNDNNIGIVTLEDIIEELVGEIYDEYFDVKYKGANNSGENNSGKEIKDLKRKPTAAN